MNTFGNMYSLSFDGQPLNGNGSPTMVYDTSWNLSQSLSFEDESSPDNSRTPSLSTSLERRSYSVIGVLTIQTTVYASVEIAPNVFNHISVLCNWDITTGARNVMNSIKGSLYRPYETHKWNQEQQITSGRIYVQDRVIQVDHSGVAIQHVWNVEQHVWEYVVYDHTQNMPAFDPYAIVEQTNGIPYPPEWF